MLMKRFIITIAVFFAFTIITKAVTTVVTINDIEYTLDIDNMTAEVEDIKSVAKSLTIPDTVDYYGYKFPVKKIRSIKSSQVKELTLPNTLRDTLNSIGANKYLKKVICPPHITCMGTTFVDCTALEEAVLPMNLKYAGAVFGGCTALRKCVLPNGVETMSKTFADCSSLESVVLPKGLKVLKDAFLNCVSLKSIDLPKSLDTIYVEFRGAKLIKRLEIPNSVRHIQKNAFEGSYIESINIPLSLVVKDFDTSNFLVTMENLKEIRIDANDKKFEWKNDVLFYNNNGEYDLWYAKDVDVLRLPSYSNINIYSKAILSCLSEVIVPNTCIKFTYQGNHLAKWANEPEYDSYCENLKKLIIEEGLIPLALGLSASGESAIATLYIRRPIVPINKTDKRYMITFSEQQYRTTTLYLNKSSSTVDLDKLYKPWSYYNGKPSMYTFHTYGPDILEFDKDVEEIMPDFRLNFIESGDLSSGKFTPNNIHTVKCHGSTPPECENLNGLTSIDAALYVPKGAWLAYVNHPFWKMFKTIQEMESESGVDDTLVDGSNTGAVEVERYDVNGRLLSEPMQGLNIVKLSNGNVRKEFVK